MDSPEVLGELAKEKFFFKCGHRIDAIKNIKGLVALGSGNAAHFLALIYDYGFQADASLIEKLLGHGKPDRDLAEYYRKISIERESSFSQYEMAVSYYFGDDDKTALKNEQNYNESYNWAVLCADNMEYSDASFGAMALLSELYACGLGCAKNYYHAVILREIADIYQTTANLDSYPVSRSFEIPPALKEAANTLGLSYFHNLSLGVSKPKVALPDSTYARVFFSIASKLF